MNPAGLKLLTVPGIHAVCRLGADDPIPAWATSGQFFSVTRTAEELSIVCAADSVPDGVRREDRWRALAVAGPLDFGVTGILAALAAPLAAARISVFTLSTYDTDYLFVREDVLERTIVALREAGHVVSGGDPA